MIPFYIKNSFTSIFSFLKLMLETLISISKWQGSLEIPISSGEAQRVRATSTGTAPKSSSPALSLNSRIPNDTAYESQAKPSQVKPRKRFFTSLLSICPSKSDIIIFPIRKTLRFQKQIIIQLYLPLYGVWPPACCPPFSPINLKALLTYFQTSHQVHFKKGHHSKHKERKKVTSRANNAAPQAGGKGSRLAGFTTIALSLGASQIRTGKRACDTTNFIWLGFNCKFPLQCKCLCGLGQIT